MSLLKTRVRLLRQSVASHGQTIIAALQQGRHPGYAKLPPLERVAFGHRLLEGISAAADRVRSAALALAGECEARGIACAVTHELAVTPGWLGSPANTAALQGKVKLLEAELSAIAAADAQPDAPEIVPMTPNEQAVFALLNDEGQTGPDLVAALMRDGIRIEPADISRISKRSHMQARGMKHRKGSGYYRAI